MVISVGWFFSVWEAGLYWSWSFPPRILGQAKAVKTRISGWTIDTTVKTPPKTNECPPFSREYIWTNPWSISGSTFVRDSRGPLKKFEQLEPKEITSTTGTCSTWWSTPGPSKRVMLHERCGDSPSVNWHHLEGGVFPYQLLSDEKVRSEWKWQQHLWFS